MHEFFDGYPGSLANFRHRHRRHDLRVMRRARRESARSGARRAQCQRQSRDGVGEGGRLVVALGSRRARCLVAAGGAFGRLRAAHGESGRCAVRRGGSIALARLRADRTGHVAVGAVAGTHAAHAFRHRPHAAGVGAAVAGCAGAVLSGRSLLSRRLACGARALRQHGLAGRTRHQRGLWAVAVVVVARRAASVLRGIGRGHHAGAARQMAGGACQAAGDVCHSCAAAVAARGSASARRARYARRRNCRERRTARRGHEGRSPCGTFR